MTRQRLDKATWIRIRPELNNSYNFSDNWAKIIELFNARVQDFYFTPIENILRPETHNGEGFSVLTLQCALIEMFAAFRQGKVHNHNKPRRNEIRPSYEYHYSDDCFIKFLETEDIFENHFYIKDKDTGEKIPNPLYNAKEFYGKVRCGLMHEARTKEDWLITAAKSRSDDNFIIYNPADRTKKINRTILQRKLKTYFEGTYIRELAEENENGNKLRRLFARKLDHLYDIPSDNEFDWWTENN